MAESIQKSLADARAAAASQAPAAPATPAAKEEPKPAERPRGPDGKFLKPEAAPAATPTPNTDEALVDLDAILGVKGLGKVKPSEAPRYVQSWFQHNQKAGESRYAEAQAKYEAAEKARAEVAAKAADLDGQISEIIQWGQSEDAQGLINFLNSPRVKEAMAQVQARQRQPQPTTQQPQDIRQQFEKWYAEKQAADHKARQLAEYHEAEKARTAQALDGLLTPIIGNESKGAQNLIRAAVAGRMLAQQKELEVLPEPMLERRLVNMIQEARDEYRIGLQETANAQTGVTNRVGPALTGGENLVPKVTRTQVSPMDQRAFRNSLEEDIARLRQSRGM